MTRFANHDLAQPSRIVCAVRRWARSLGPCVLPLIVTLTPCGCRTTDRRPPADYREDQATRQAERDADSTDPQRRRPLERPNRDRQDVIDQPR